MMMKNETHMEQSGNPCRTVPQNATPDEYIATEKFCSLLIHPGDYTAAAVETRRRIHILVETLLLKKQEKDLVFDAATLTKITAWFDVMPKNLGYFYLPTLEREAKILIPKAIHCPLDKSELLNSVIIFFINAHNLNCPQLIVGLYIILFYALRHFKMFQNGWCEYVDWITNTYSLIHGGYYVSRF